MIPWGLEVDPRIQMSSSSRQRVPQSPEEGLVGKKYLMIVRPIFWYKAKNQKTDKKTKIR